MSVTPDDTGNFALRWGYCMGALHSPEMRAYLIGRGATEAELDAAWDAMLALANSAFYRRMGQP